jgi:hypothetical protein
MIYSFLEKKTIQARMKTIIPITETIGVFHQYFGYMRLIVEGRSGL